MVMMGDPFVGNAPKKLTKEELIQALRVDIAGEMEAIMAYDAHAMATDDERVKTILYSIRDEERQHVGELIHLLEILDPQEAQFLMKGKQEVDQLLGQNMQAGQTMQSPQRNMGPTQRMMNQQYSGNLSHNENPIW
jgi:rubrerythrin